MTAATVTPDASGDAERIAEKTGYNRRTSSYLLREFEEEPGENFGAMN